MNTATYNFIREEAEWMLKNRATVRQASEYFGRSKSAIHVDMRQRLPHIDKFLARQIVGLLETNKDEASARGGEATHKKFAKKKMKFGVLDYNSLSDLHMEQFAQA